MDRGSAVAGPRTPTALSARALLVRIALLSLGARVALEALGLVSLAAHGQAVGSGWLTMWRRWDAPHYLRLAEVGYVSGQPPPDDPLFIVFFPLYPAVVAMVGLVVRDLLVSGLLVSWVASVGAGWLLYRHAERLVGSAAAWRTVVLLFAFPTAYFLAAPYTEALFLCAILGALTAAQHGRWPVVAASGAAATAARVAGVALAPALIVRALRQGGPTRALAGRLAWIVVAGTGLAAYLLINQVVHGDPFWFLEVQRFHWFQQATWPWMTVVDAVRTLPSATGEHSFILLGRLAAVLLAVPLLIVAARRLPAEDSIYAWAGLVLVCSTSWLISLPRYLLGLYPLFIVGAQLTHRRRVFVAVVGASIVGQAYLFWRFASGAWTY